MRQVEQLELPLWEILQEAAIAPDAANLQQLLEVLDESLSNLDTVAQLQVGAEAIRQIVEVFHERSTLAFEELEATNSNDGPVMSEDAFDRYVRQTMEVDLEQFIEPLASLPRKSPERQELLEGDSVVGVLDQAAVLQVLAERMSQQPTLTEAEIFNQALALAHDEDIAAWVEIIFQRLQQEHKVMPITELVDAVHLPLLSVWLSVLLGSEFVVEQRGQFYDLSGVWVSIRQCLL